MKTLCGEIQKVDITIKNVGNAPLSNIYLASTDAKLISLEDEQMNTQEGTLFTFTFTYNSRL